MKLSILALAAFVFTAGITVAQQNHSKTINDCWDTKAGADTGVDPNRSTEDDCPGLPPEPCCYQKISQGNYETFYLPLTPR